MLERFKRRQDGRDGATATTATATAADGAPTAPADASATRARTRRRARRHRRTHAPRVRARQREAYGGINWGAAFFGWLVAVGMAVLLTGLLGAAGAAIGLTGTSPAPPTRPRDRDAHAGGAIALLVVLHRRLLRRVRGRADVALRRRAPGHRRRG